MYEWVKVIVLVAVISNAMFLAGAVISGDSWGKARASKFRGDEAKPFFEKLWLWNMFTVLLPFSPHLLYNLFGAVFG